MNFKKTKPDQTLHLILILVMIFALNLFLHDFNPYWFPYPTNLKPSLYAC